MLVVLAVIGAAACGQSAPKSPSPEPPTVAATPSTPRASTVTATALPSVSRTVAPTPGSQHGTLRVAVADIPPATFLPSNLKYPLTLNYMSWGVTDPITYQPALAPGLKDPVPQGLATKWTMAPDQKSVTFEFRQGVTFSKGWGELTAADVVYTFNEALKPGSFAKIAEQSVWMGTWEQTGPDSAVMHAAKGALINPVWARLLSNNAEWGGIWSKKVYDQLGPEKANQTPVGTGPFEVQKWIGSQEVDLQARPHHFRETPKVQGVVIRAIPEEATRLAAFKAGEVDISPISARFIDNVVNATGAHTVPVRDPLRTILWFSGNFWSKTNPVTDEAVPERPAFQPDAEHPWIGNPDDPNQMSQAAKVRWAISLAIDRNALNQEILKGHGSVGPDTFYGFQPGDALYKSEWAQGFDFDLPKAKQLLTEAGYPNGFSINFYISPDTPGVLGPTLPEAVAQMLQDNLSLQVHIDETAYAAERSKLVNREFNGLYITPWPYYPPSEPQLSFQGPIAGWNPGVEIPEATEAWEKTRVEYDPQRRLQINAAAQDQLYTLRWNSIVLTTATLDVVAPNVAWHPTSLNGASAGDFEKAVITG